MDSEAIKTAYKAGYYCHAMNGEVGENPYHFFKDHDLYLAFRIGYWENSESILEPAPGYW